jgi:trehalose synthase
MQLAPTTTLQRVETLPVHLEAYCDHVQPALLNQIRALAAFLRGVRVVHINATPNGGGVAEILRSLVPLSRDVGLDADWYVLPSNEAFFHVTKKLHNWLQGQSGEFTLEDQRMYTAYLQRVAERMSEMAADIWIIHDPQPLPLRSLVPLKGATIWRCHIDCSTPNAMVRDYLLPWVLGYDRAVFSMPQFVLPGISAGQARIVHPAIDPLTPKNCQLPMTEAKAILANLGIDTSRPLVAQISRFDPWKNPCQAVDAYRLAKRQIPGLQLALVGGVRGAGRSRRSKSLPCHTALYGKGSGCAFFYGCRACGAAGGQRVPVRVARDSAELDPRGV